MKILALSGAIVFALSLCGLTNKLTESLKGDSTPQNSSTNSSANSAKRATADEPVDKPKLSEQQQSILGGADEVKWDDQGMSWKLPKGWKKMNATKDSFNYNSPDLAFLLVNISNMPNSFPA